MIVSNEPVDKLEQLIAEAKVIAPSMASISDTGNFGRMDDKEFDHAVFLVWNARCLNLLSRLQAGATIHYGKFVDEEDCGRAKGHPGYHSVSIEVFHKLAVLKALKADIAEGLLFDYELLVAADALRDILEQAQHLLKKRYKDAAAVLAGAVLEATLRKLCDKRKILYTTKEGINSLNNKLKDMAYNLVVHKQITAWAEIRNKAAHGEFKAYSQREVEDMLRWIEDFRCRQLV